MHPSPPGGAANSYSLFREGLPTPHITFKTSRPSGRISLPPPAHWEGLLKPPGLPRRPSNPYPHSRRDSRPLLMLREGLQ